MCQNIFEPNEMQERTLTGRLSIDGYVRLTIKDLFSTPFVHLVSGLDENRLIEWPTGACETTITGYTEWLSETRPLITMGWDWTMDFTGPQPACIRIDDPRSNIMLIDSEACDLGGVRTDSLLCFVVDEIAWSQTVLAAIKGRYC